MEQQAMGTYVIERAMNGAGNLSDAEAAGVARKSCDVLNGLGTEIQWVESYVTDDRVYCVYRTTDPELLRRHAEQSGFPADRISQVRRRIDPTMA